MSFKGKRIWILAAALIVAVAPIPFLLQAQSEAVIYQEASDSIERQLPARQAELQRIEGLLISIKEAKTQVDRFDDLVNSKSNWLLFFAELQSALFDIGDVWLDELLVDRTGSGANIRYRLSVEGRLLVRQQDSDQVVGINEIDETLLSNRIRTLSDVFTSSPFISERLSLRIDFQAIQGGQPLLPFEFIFSIEPERPL
jgi:hypothetical protein